MPDIYGKYTLTEFATNLGVTTAFINRVQRETGIGGPLGIRGQAAVFNSSDYLTFQRIAALRRIDFSFKEIKDIWGIEKKLILDSEDITSHKYPSIKLDTMNLILHFNQDGSPARVNKPADEDDYKKYLTKSKNLDMFENHIDGIYCIRKIKKEVERRREIFLKEVEETNRFVGEIIKEK